MNFQVKDLRQILYSIRANNIYRLNIKSKKFELLINKHNIINHKNYKIIKPNYSNNIAETLTKTENNIKNIHYSNNNNTQIHKHESISYSTIISPMVGTFYRSPAPNEPQFVEKYDIVDKKQTVCIIEAMKLMNEIEAEVNGKIVEILVQDGEIVDCGQALMKVQKI
uniref:Biotin carboxyl carrier protein of acetyl-CoA carboxylase n=2 Tax=Gracilariopsis TaxID=2781 RepID=A0A1C9CES9_9FLOR|nr:acetyl-CoA carboxylase biotin carboxyl carrier protein [Gracilariopsis lemaneiformis]YP_009294607.1 acetyl-CoA carboxylase biotin carboxyl carrier protein [Gracilariopsis chorda]AJO68449.1 acetyl-CoA carboxylase biotin carboxyl carrier protein [Gracilariopsis lemaneiformis]AML79771.1 acetyl-CoA carboxylase biotin carboxyl carrier protein [Gracilariopsis lemaneiformis]AOM66867.1 acetyl-CoA carboxylase biotin carboxyl carrier protein [Gracilariopsis chorda]UAD88873.1 acetyl-CoA carboxylase, b